MLKIHLAIKNEGSYYIPKWGGGKEGPLRDPESELLLGGSARRVWCEHNTLEYMG